MKNRKYKDALLLVLFGLLLAGSVLYTGWKEKQRQTAYTEISWYADIDFWEPPEWTTQKGTIMGDISGKTGVVPKLKILQENADARLKWMLLYGELTDVISVVDETTEHQLATSGKVWDIQEFFEKYKPDSHLLTEFPEDIRQVHIKRNGGWYAIPSHMMSADARRIWKQASQYWIDRALYGDETAIIWNKALLKQLGIREESLHTESGALKAMEIAKNSGISVNGKQIIPLLLDGDDYYGTTFRLILETFGAEYVDEDGNYTDALLQPEAKQALAFLNRTVQNGYVNVLDLALESNQIQDLASSGRVFCFIGNITDFQADENTWYSPGAILSGDGSSPVHGENFAASDGWIKTFIAKDCKNPEKVAEWMDYMTSDEGLLFWNFGYEGTDYRMDENGLICRTETGRHNEKNLKQTGYTAWWPFVNTAWMRSVTSGQEEEKYGNLMNAYGKDEHTVQYNSALLQFPQELFEPGSKDHGVEQAVEQWKKDQVLTVIVAESDEQFGKEYQTLVDGLLERGIGRVDQIKNQAYQKNCIQYGETIQKVNRQEQEH